MRTWFLSTRKLFISYLNGDVIGEYCDVDGDDFYFVAGSDDFVGASISSQLQGIR